MKYRVLCLALLCIVSLIQWPHLSRVPHSRAVPARGIRKCTASHRTPATRHSSPACIRHRQPETVRINLMVQSRTLHVRHVARCYGMKSLQVCAAEIMSTTPAVSAGNNASCTHATSLLQGPRLETAHPWPPSHSRTRFAAASMLLSARRAFAQSIGPTRRQVLLPCHSQASTQRNSDLLNLAGLHNGVVDRQLRSVRPLVVEGARMRLSVAVLPAEEAATLAREACEPDLAEGRGGVRSTSGKDPDLR